MLEAIDERLFVLAECTRCESDDIEFVDGMPMRPVGRVHVFSDFHFVEPERECRESSDKPCDERTFFRPENGIETHGIAWIDYAREIVERFEMARLYVEEDLLVVVHVQNAVLGKDTYDDARCCLHGRIGCRRRR